MPSTTSLAQYLDGSRSHMATHCSSCFSGLLPVCESKKTWGSPFPPQCPGASRTMGRFVFRLSCWGFAW